jgi:hypothetical protein
MLEGCSSKYWVARHFRNQLLCHTTVCMDKHHCSTTVASDHTKERGRMCSQPYLHVRQSPQLSMCTAMAIETSCASRTTHLISEESGVKKMSVLSGGALWEMARFDESDVLGKVVTSCPWTYCNWHDPYHHREKGGPLALYIRHNATFRLEAPLQPLQAVFLRTFVITATLMFRLFTLLKPSLLAAKTQDLGWENTSCVGLRRIEA